MSAEKLIADINQVRAEFEKWRATKIGRKRIPEPLWRAAAALLDYYPLKIVSQELHLSPKDLRKHRQIIRPLPQPAKASNAGQFLEVNADTVKAANNCIKNPPTLISATPGVCQLLIEKKDGSRLTISLPLEWNRIESLCANLLRS
jgi:hypothetical protein